MLLIKPHSKVQKCGIIFITITNWGTASLFWSVTKSTSTIDKFPNNKPKRRQHNLAFLIFNYLLKLAKMSILSFTKLSKLHNKLQLEALQMSSQVIKSQVKSNKAHNNKKKMQKRKVLLTLLQAQTLILTTQMSYLKTKKL